MTQTSLKPASDMTSHRQSRALLVLSLILLVAVAIAFGRTVTADFVHLDDARYVFEKPEVTGGFTAHNIWWACTNRDNQFWIPLTWLSLQLDATLTVPAPTGSQYAPPARPSAMIFHLSNIIYHAAAALMLFLFLRRLTDNTYASFAAALLWAIHPLRLESVAWVTERKDVLSGIFGFLALYLYVGWTRKKSFWGYFAATAAATASLMAKPMTLAMPCVWLLLDFWPLARWKRPRDILPLLREKIPLFVICALCAAATYYVQRGIGGPAAGPAARLANAIAAYGRYLWMQADFRNLTVLYPYAPPPLWLVALSALALIVITAFSIALRKKRPAILLGWLWYLGTFAPTIGLFNFGPQGYADRFTYFPAVGLAIAFVGMFPDRLCAGAARWRILAATGALAAACVACTLYLAGFWQNSVLLFERARAISGEDPIVLRALAAGYVAAGRYDDAIAAYQHIPEENERSDNPRDLRIAQVYFYKQDTASAVIYLRRALVICDAPNMHKTLGYVLLLEHHWDEAAEEFEKVLQQNPLDPAAQEALDSARLHQEMQFSNTPLHLP